MVTHAIPIREAEPYYPPVKYLGLGLPLPLALSP
jgi:hypothetical protein